MKRTYLFHPITICVLLILISSVPFATLAAVSDDPHRTDTEIVVGIHGPGNDGYVIGYDSDGREKWRVGDAIAYFDVTQLESGNVLATYAKNGDDCATGLDGCGETGLRIIDPQTETIVWEWHKEIKTIHNSEIHDAEPTDNGFLFIDMDTERVYHLNKSTGKTTVVWDADSVYSPPADRTETDWLHANDIDQLGDEKLLVSIRNANQLLIVNRTDGTVRETINKNKSTSILNHQHNPQLLTENRMLVADSENRRIVELQENNGTWDVAWELTEQYNKAFLWPRDADRLPNGNTLITDSRNHRVLEINAKGETLNVWQTEELPYEADALSSGEPVGGTPYTSSTDTSRGLSLPGFKTLHIALNHVIGLPAWVTEWHVGLWFLSVVGVITGLIGETKRRYL